MRRWRWKAVLLVTLLLCVVALLSQRQPHYHGRSLESWLKQYAQAPLVETQQLAEAQSAIQAIGARQALPDLLALVKTRDSRAREWLSDKADRYGRRLVQVHSATQLQLWGIAGFEVLGSDAAPAVPELTRLLDDSELAFASVRCLDFVGKSAESPLCRALTNQNWQVRRWAVFALASATEDLEVYLTRITSRLKDVEPAVRVATVQALGDQDHAPDLTVPLLISALEDPEDSVCGQAANALAGFGTNAVSAFSTLTNLVANGRIGQVRAALKALPDIDPVAAIPVLSNSVVQGNPRVLVTALRSLKEVVPEMAITMTLDAFDSRDSTRRMAAISVAPNFDPYTPGLAAALKKTAIDSNPEIAKRATMTMRQMVNKQKEQSGYTVIIPAEPRYAGKLLGEWLKQRNENQELSSNALEALRHIGTNGIPALLARLTYREPAFGLFDADVSIEAVHGLHSLQEQVLPVLPTLAEIMESDDPNVALRAMLATLGAGSNAMPYLIRGLTNRFADVRNEAANYLLGEWGSQFSEQQRQAIPILHKLLEDSEQSVRITVTNGLIGIGATNY